MSRPAVQHQSSPRGPVGQATATAKRDHVGQVVGAGSNLMMGTKGAVSSRKKRKLGDKIIPNEVRIREMVPESEAYMNLLAFEQTLDSTISRKKLDIQEALKRPLKVKRRLRIYVSHTFYSAKEVPSASGGATSEKEGANAEQQTPPTSSGGGGGSVPMWELRVEGRLLDEQQNSSSSSSAGNVGQPQQSSSDQPAAAGVRNANSSAVGGKRKFSSFFKSLVIELDKDIYGPDNHLVEWHRTPQTNETDGFQVKRPGDQNVKCTILLLLDYQPLKYKLHPKLAKLLGLHTETRPKIIEALWQYIKTHRLQDAVERDHINCDVYLEQVFMCRRMRFMEIPQRLQLLLQQPDPVVINHTITVEGNDPKKTACYDIEVEIEDPLKQLMSQFAASTANAAEINGYDNKIYETVEQIAELKQRRDFYLKFSEDPVRFTQKWLISQSKDLKTIREAGDEDFGEEQRNTTYYYEPWVQEAVFRHIYHKVQQRRTELESTLGVNRK